MNNVLYSRTLVSVKDSSDGDTATVIYATKESNGYAVFLQTPERGTELLQWFQYSPNLAIEHAVRYELPK